MKPSKNISWFREGHWGLAFKGGKLYEFENSCVLVISAWPNPQAWFKNQSRGWQPNQEMADNLLSRRLFPAGTPTPPKPEKPFVLPNGQMILHGIEIMEERLAKINHNEFMALEGYSQPAKVDQQTADKRGEIELGGCCVGDNDPNFHCKACGHEWRFQKSTKA